MLQRKEKYDYKNYENTQKDEKNNSHIIVLYVIFIAFIGILFSIHIAQTVTISHLSYEVEKLENELDEIESKNNQLELKTAKKLSLSNIEKIARNKLGMVKAEKTKYITLNNKNNEKHNKINSKDSDFLKGIYQLLEKLETVKASSP